MFPEVHAVDDATCDGVDDDCDGKMDEDYGFTVVECGEGACLSTGNIYCSEGEILNSCETGIPGVLDATCDGIDDDCDGQVDEDFVPGVSSCGIGACGNSGTTACVDGKEEDVCTPLDALEADDNCNGIDEDCDGFKDEHFSSGVVTTCGVGKCAEEGTIVCSEGELVDSCEPANPSADDASCNGVDDDCDGLIDEDYLPEPSPVDWVCALQAVRPCASTGR